MAATVEEELQKVYPAHQEKILHSQQKLMLEVRQLLVVIFQFRPQLEWTQADKRPLHTLISLI